MGRRLPRHVRVRIVRRGRRGLVRRGEGEAEDFASDQTGCAYEEKSRHQDETRAGIGAAANGIGRGGTELGK